MANLKFIDAQTKRKGRLRLTVFGDQMDAVAKEFQVWARENKLTQKDIWYANIFECGTDKHLGYCRIDNDDYQISIHPVINSKLSPYSRSLKQLLQFFLP